ncbi:MAG: hypothetical protein GXO14_06045 [Thermococci archaeon]|nr:hypothetical protein [Thermococci archaeon]
MRRRGFIFTLDALLSIMLIMLVVASITMAKSDVGRVYSTVMRSENTYTAESIMSILDTVPLSSLVSATVIENWTESGVLNTSLYVSPSTPPLRIALVYWALANMSQYRSLDLLSKAREILNYTITHNFPGYGYQLLVNSSDISSFGNASNATDISVASAVISGYKKNQTIQGYISRAYLTYVQHRYSQLVGIQRLVALGYDNTLKVEIPVDLPLDARDISAKGAFYARITPYNDIYLTVTNETGTYTYGDLGSGSSVDLSGYIGPGNNVLNFTITSGGGDEVGFGSGSVLLTSYVTNSTSFQNPNKIDLYDVKSYYGFVQFVTVVPTGNVTGITIYLKASGINSVNLYYNNGTSVCYTGLSKTFVGGSAYFNSSEVEAGLERCGVNYSDLNSKAFTLVLGFDTTWPSGSPSSKPSYSSSYRLRHLYGFGQSWVQVDVKSDLAAMQYAIPLSIPLYPGNFSYSGYTRVGSNIYESMSASYYLPPKAYPWYADYWTAIEYRGTPSGNLTFSEYNPVSLGTILSEGPLNYYLYRFGYARYTKDIMINGTTNTFKAESTSSYYGFREGESWGSVYYFLKAYAPYGRVFSKLAQGYPSYRGYNLTYWANFDGKLTERSILVGNPPYKNIAINQLNPAEYAVDDAIVRLFSQLAGGGTGRPGSQGNPLIVLLPPSVQVGFAAMNGIPGLFTPVPVRIRVWRLP